MPRNFAWAPLSCPPSTTRGLAMDIGWNVIQGFGLLIGLIVIVVAAQDSNDAVALIVGILITGVFLITVINNFMDDQTIVADVVAVNKTQSGTKVTVQLPGTITTESTNPS